jgi:hypothetical protein
MFELIEKQNMEAIVSYLIVRMAIVLLCWTFIFIANVVDFCSGRNTAKAIGEPIDSKGYRRTFTKIGDYYRVLIFALLFDLIGSLFSFYTLPFATILGSLAVIAIELSSVVENSRRKKSHAGDVPEMVKKIVQCTTTDKGKELLGQITKELSKK